MVDFIHIGLGKSMSSSLQQIWATSSNYDWIKPDDVVNTIREAAQKAHETGEMPEYNFDINFGGDNLVKIVTSEGMVYGSPLDKTLPVHQLMMAKAFGKHTNKALLIVRNPISWIKSAYVQLLNQGDSIKFSEYLTESQNCGLLNLNLKYILDCWNSQGVEVTILPMEELIREPKEFWGNYESSLGFPAPSNAENLPRVNSSNYDLLDLRRLLNEVSDKLIEIAQRNPGHDTETVVNVMQSAKEWGLRRAIEVMSPDEEELIRSYLNVGEHTEQLSVQLTHSSQQMLKENFIKPLQNGIISEAILNEYVEAINGSCK